MGCRRLQVHHHIHRRQILPPIVATEDLPGPAFEAIADNGFSYLATRGDTKTCSLASIGMEVKAQQGSVSLSTMPVATLKVRPPAHSPIQAESFLLLAFLDHRLGSLASKGNPLHRTVLLHSTKRRALWRELFAEFTTNRYSE